MSVPPGIPDEPPLPLSVTAQAKRAPIRLTHLRRLQLPMVTRSNLPVCLIAGYVVFCALYLGSAAVSRAAVGLVPSALDRAVPFVAASILVYLSQFLLLPYALVAARDDGARSHAFYSMLLATLLAAVIFVCFPTSVMRPTPPLDGLLGLAWRGLHLADTPNNGFPSLHVALAAIAGMLLWQTNRRALAIIWPALISLSTLTTRQHIAWDIAGGLLLAASAWRLTPTLISYERTHTPDHSARS